MSRSFRHTPIGGTVGGRHTSEKEDKQLWHRAFRRAEKQAIHHEKEMPVRNELSDTWGMSKDGKSWMPHWWEFGFGSAQKDMRK